MTAAFSLGYETLLSFIGLGSVHVTCFCHVLYIYSRNGAEIRQISALCLVIIASVFELIFFRQSLIAIGDSVLLTTDFTLPVCLVQSPFLGTLSAKQFLWLQKVHCRIKN